MTGDLILRPAASSRAVTIAYGVLVAAPRGIGMIAGVFFLMSFDVDVVFVVGAVVCALVGPLLVVLLPLGLQGARNIEVVLTQYELRLLDESGQPVRSIPLQSITGVWHGYLPPGAAASSVPKLPRTVFVVAGTKERPIVLHGEWRKKDLQALWQRLGRFPVEIGSVTERELDERFPGVTESLAELLGNSGLWWRVYRASAVLLLGFIAVATIFHIVR